MELTKICVWNMGYGISFFCLSVRNLGNRHKPNKRSRGHDSYIMLIQKRTKRYSFFARTYKTCVYSKYESKGPIYILHLLAFRKKSICQVLLILNPNRPVEYMSIVCLQHLQLKDRQK